MAEPAKISIDYYVTLAIYLHKNSLSRKQNITVFLPPPPVVFDHESPLAPVFHPSGLSHPMTQLDVAIQIPFTSPVENILLYLGAAGIETRPIRVWVKGKSLKNSQ